MPVILHKAPMTPMQQKFLFTPKEAASTFFWGDKENLPPVPSSGHSQSWKLLMPPCGPLVAAEGWKNRLKTSLTTEEPCGRNALGRDRDQSIKSQEWKYSQPPGMVHCAGMQNHLLEQSRVLRSFPYK